MGCFRPATPGFLVCLAATICLGLVSFSVPIIKSVYFLRATLNEDDFDGTITIGTLGYCIDQSNGTTCSKPSVGYEFDPNALLGDDISFAQIPDIIVKWVTYVLVLHIVAFVLAAISTFIGLLAHCQEFATTCFSSCIAGFGAAVSFLAVIFDFVLFFTVKDRADGASFGTAIWLTLAAWLLLTFSGCFYTFGRCCIRSRPSRLGSPNSNDSRRKYSETHVPLQPVPGPVSSVSKRPGMGPENGLPAFQEHVPLSQRVQYLEEEEDDSYAPVPARGPSTPAVQNDPRPKYPGGYVSPHQQPAQNTRVQEGSSPGYSPQANDVATAVVGGAYNEARRQPSGYTRTSPRSPANYQQQQQQQQYLAPGQARGQQPSYGSTVAGGYHNQQPSNYSQAAPYQPTTYNSTSPAMPSAGNYGGQTRQPSAGAYEDPYHSLAAAAGLHSGPGLAAPVPTFPLAVPSPGHDRSYTSNSGITSSSLTSSRTTPMPQPQPQVAHAQYSSFVGEHGTGAEAGATGYDDYYEDAYGGHDDGVGAAVEENNNTRSIVGGPISSSPPPYQPFASDVGGASPSQHYNPDLKHPSGPGGNDGTNIAGGPSSRSPTLGMPQQPEPQPYQRRQQSPNGYYNTTQRQTNRYSRDASNMGYGGASPPPQQPQPQHQQSWQYQSQSQPYSQPSYAGAGAAGGNGDIPASLQPRRPSQTQGHQNTRSPTGGYSNNAGGGYGYTR